MSAGERAQPPTDRRAGAWGEFRVGLTRPSAAALAVALAVVVAIFASAAVWAETSFFQSDLAYYVAQNGLDLDAFATVDAMGLSRRKAEAPLAVILGASATLDSVSPGVLARELRAVSGERHDVYKLTTGGQDLWDSMMLASAIPAGQRGVVVIATSPGRFVHGRERLERLAGSPRIGVPSPWFDMELRRCGIGVPLRTGVYLLDHHDFLFVRVPAFVRSFLRGPQVRRDMPTIGGEVISAGRWATTTPRIVDALSNWDAHVEDNLQVLARLIGHLRGEKGVAVLLVEAPVNPRFLREPGMEALFRRHRERLRAFAATHGVPYVDVATEIDVGEDDFRDWFHLRKAATARRYTARLARHMVGPAGGLE